MFCTFTFNVTIGKVGFIPSIFLLVFYMSMPFCFLLPPLLPSFLLHRYFGALLLGTCLYCMSSCWIGLIISIKCSSLSLLTIFVLKSTSSDIGIGPPVRLWILFLWYNFFHPYTFKLFVSLNLKAISYLEGGGR